MTSHWTAPRRTGVPSLPLSHLPKTGHAFRYPDEAEHRALQERNLLWTKVANDRDPIEAIRDRLNDDATVRFTLPDAIITAAIAVLIGMICAGCWA